MIEDFMLLANETVAEDYFWQEIPFVYRTHEYPDNEKIEKLRLFIKNYGYNFPSKFYQNQKIRKNKNKK